MVELPDLAKRKDTGIDTLERAVIYSATLLKACYTSNLTNSKIDQRIKITHKIGNNKEARIIIEANLAFNNILALKEGGYVLNSLNKHLDIPLLETEYNCQPSTNKEPVLQLSFAANLDSLEQYFYYHCSLLKASLNEESEYVNISLLENASEGGIIKISATLPFDFKSWLIDNNYVCSVNRIANEYVIAPVGEPIQEEATSDFSNSSTLGNNSIIGN
jgi:hypothetical protein